MAGTAQAAKPPLPDYWWVFGHSWFNFATGPVDQTGRVDALLRAALDVEQHNWAKRAVDGARMVSENKASGGWVRIMQDRVPPLRTAQPYAPWGGGTILGYGMNDLGVIGGSNNTRLFAAMAHAMRAMIVRCRASVVWEDSRTAGVGAHTYGAGFVSNSPTSDQGSGTSNRWATSITNANFSVTLPSDYNGEPVWFQWLGRPAAPTPLGGVITWSGTAGVTGTTNLDITDSAWNTHTPVIQRITNLTSANAGQTIIATVSTFDAGGNIFYDCWGLESFTPPPVIVLNIAKMTAAGYASPFYTAWTGTQAQKDADIASANAAIAAVVAEFDSMVQIANCDELIGNVASATSDGIHPNETGAGQIADSILLAIQRLSPGTMASSDTLSFNSPSNRLGTVVRPRQPAWWHTTDFDTHAGAVPGTAGDQYAVPFLVQMPTDVYDLVGLEVTTAGTVSGSVRWGVYDDPSYRGYPDCLIAGGEPTSAGAFTPALSTGLQTQATAGVPWRLDPGLYWLCMKIITAGTGQSWRWLTNSSLNRIYFPAPSSAGVLPASGQSIIAWKHTGQGTGALPGQYALQSGATLTNTCPAMFIHKA